jgi:hypothetical protein
MVALSSLLSGRSGFESRQSSKTKTITQGMIREYLFFLKKKMITIVLHAT